MTAWMFADVIWPALFLQSRLVALWAIALGLIIEFFVLLWPLGMRWQGAVLADLLMNLVSVGAGIFLIPISGLAWELGPGRLVNAALDAGTFNPVSWVATCALAILVDATLELFIIPFFFMGPSEIQPVLL